MGAAPVVEKRRRFARLRSDANRFAGLICSRVALSAWWPPLPASASARLLPAA